jgi:tetratricopeptide (TPR) repeat protein
VTRGRKHLHEQPVREIVQKLTLQDWLVPIVYEARAMQVFTPPPTDLPLTIDIKPADATPKRGMLDEDLPPEPDVGFFGRDETLLTLDRGFDRQQVMLLYAYAGSGKTTAAAEFARWYSLTGGVQGPVLFTSFEQHKPLVQVLDQLGRMFDPLLRQNGIQWDAIPDAAQKRDIALQILTQVPVLWLWDNVEPVAGFPAGTPSAWTEAEQRELLTFLRDAQQTQAKFLLTSRRDERGWLGDLPTRVAMLPMPMHERRQLAEALAAKYGVAFDQATWRPLLVYSGGNPLTLTVVGQALRDGLRMGQQFSDYVQRLRAGEAAFDDDESQGRTRSLGASLSYGFDTAFTEDERRVLALLHHFQGFVDVDALTWMGDTSDEWHVRAIAGISREQSIALLDRAAEVGLLAAYGGGAYRIHPALPWFFRRLYEQSYPDDAPTHAYVEAIGELGDCYHNQYADGNQDVIALLMDEEANLLHARRLAQQHGWYDALTSTMQGLDVLYDHTGRRAEWRRLVQEIVPLFVDPATDGPLPGRAEDWAFVTEYRVRLLREERQWSEVARLQGLHTDYNRQRAAPLLALPPVHLGRSQCAILRSLAVSFAQLGHIQREQGDAACVDSYLESYELALRIGDQPLAASCAFNLGHAYKGDFVPALCDLAQAEQWYQDALDGWPEHDQLNQGKTLGQLGMVAYERFQAAWQADEWADVLAEHLNTALDYYQQALDMTPPDAAETLAVNHNQLGLIYRHAGQIEQAVAHSHAAIRYEDMQGNLYGAATSRYNVALAYADAGNFDDALLFAQTALRNFEDVGPAAAAEAALAQQAITWIERLARGGG